MWIWTSCSQWDTFFGTLFYLSGQILWNWHYNAINLSLCAFLWEYLFFLTCTDNVICCNWLSWNVSSISVWWYHHVLNYSVIATPCVHICSRSLSILSETSQWILSPMSLKHQLERKNCLYTLQYCLKNWVYDLKIYSEQFFSDEIIQFSFSLLHSVPQTVISDRNRSTSSNPRQRD